MVGWLDKVEWAASQLRCFEWFFMSLIFWVYFLVFTVLCCHGLHAACLMGRRKGRGGKYYIRREKKTRGIRIGVWSPVCYLDRSQVCC